MPISGWLSLFSLLMFSSLSTLLALFRLMRPHQWVKNVFVFAGLVFSQSWENTSLDLKVLQAVAAFCSASSMVYILNDWHDRASDALHPTKSRRPLASGAVSGGAALVLATASILPSRSRTEAFRSSWPVAVMIVAFRRNTGASGWR